MSKDKTNSIQKARVWRFGSNIDTDQILPSQYLVLSNFEEMATHCLETIDESFAQRVRRGDAIVAGLNFGCGSSREQAVTVLKTLGISCVIAKSFARIFFRNAINNGLPAIQFDNSDQIEEGMTITVDLTKGTLSIEESGKDYTFDPFTGMIENIINAGGLIPFMKKGGI